MIIIIVFPDVPAWCGDMNELNSIRRAQSFVFPVNPIGEAIDVPPGQETIAGAAGKCGLGFVGCHVCHEAQ